MHKPDQTAPETADRPEGEIEATPARSIGDRVGVLAGLAVGAAFTVGALSTATVSSLHGGGGVY